MPQNVLFICSVNKQRSKTAEDYFSSKYPSFQFQSAGTNIKQCEREGTNSLLEEMLIWADTIFVMENKHSKFIKDTFENNFQDKIIVLKIDDKYKYYQKELIELLLTKNEKYFA